MANFSLLLDKVKDTKEGVSKIFQLFLFLFIFIIFLQVNWGCYVMIVQIPAELDE